FNQLSKHSKIKVLNYAGEFNYSAINNFAAKNATGEVLALVNNDIEVIEPNWLTNMVSHVMRDDIGCVGAKLLYSD
ncbi:glycosyl transferase, partial [Pseudoalteromonas piscicida]